MVADAHRLLVILLELASEKPNAIGVTLSAGGLLISGTAISEEEYIERFGQLLAAGQWSPGTATAQQEMPAGYDELAREARDRTAERKRRKDELDRRADELMAGGSVSDDDRATLRQAFEELEPGVVYLRDAQLYGVGMGSLAVPLWQVRLSDISGWNIGTFGPPVTGK